MNRAKVVIDSKFSDATFREIWGFQEIKMTKLLPLPQKLILHFFELKFFCENSDLIGMRICFVFEKNTDCRRQKKLNTEDILKNHGFYGVKSFPEAAKLCGNNILNPCKKSD